MSCCTLALTIKTKTEVSKDRERFQNIKNRMDWQEACWKTKPKLCIEKDVSQHFGLVGKRRNLVTQMNSQDGSTLRTSNFIQIFRYPNFPCMHFLNKGSAVKNIRQLNPSKLDALGRYRL